MVNKSLANSRLAYGDHTRAPTANAIARAAPTVNTLACYRAPTANTITRAAPTVSTLACYPRAYGKHNRVRRANGKRTRVLRFVHVAIVLSNVCFEELLAM